MTSNTTINVRGERTFNIQTTLNPSKQVTIAVTVTASGKKLHEAVVFKGKPNCQVEKEFGGYAETYRAHGLYYIQPKAWMGKHVMMLWVDQVL